MSNEIGVHLNHWTFHMPLVLLQKKTGSFHRPLVLQKKQLPSFQTCFRGLQPFAPAFLHNLLPFLWQVPVAFAHSCLSFPVAFSMVIPNHGGMLRPRAREARTKKKHKDWQNRVDLTIEKCEVRPDMDYNHDNGPWSFLQHVPMALSHLCLPFFYGLQPFLWHEFMASGHYSLLFTWPPAIHVDCGSLSAFFSPWPSVLPGDFFLSSAHQSSSPSFQRDLWSFP